MSRPEPARPATVAGTWSDRHAGERRRPVGATSGHRAAADSVSQGLWRGDLYGVLILLMLTAIVALDGAREGRLLFRTDIVTAYLPWYSHLGERLRDLDIPGWLPYSFSGTAFAGDPESGWMYLPAMVIFTIAPGVAGFNAFIVFHLLVAGLATYVLARLLGMTVLGAVAAGAAFEFGGFLERTRCCTVHAQVAMWVPVAFIGIEMAVRARSWLARVGWWALAGLSVSQMLTGWLGQGSYYGLLAVGAYVLYRTLVSPPDERRSPASRLVAAASHGAAILVVGFGLAAGGIWPRVEVVGRSLLAGGNYNAVGGEEPGWSVLETADRLLTLDNRGGRSYASGAVVTLALLAPFLARRRFSTPFLTIYTLLVLGLSMREFWLHDILFALPQLAELHRHSPERALTVFYIGPALLAGAAVSALSRPMARSWRLAALALVPPAGLLLLFRPFERAGAPPNDLTIYAVGAVGLLVALAALVRAPLVARAVPVLLLLAIFADPTGRLVHFRLDNPQSTTFVKAFHGPAGTVVGGYTEVDPAARFLQERQAASDQPIRFFGYDPAQLYYRGDQRTYIVRYYERETQALLLNNRSVLLGLEDVQGYNPIQSARYVELIAGINGVEQSYHQANILYRGIGSPLLDLLGARYVVVPAAVPAGRPDLLHLSQRHATVYTDQEVRIVENLGAFPRAWIVHEAQRVEPDRTFKLLVEGRVNPRDEALLDKEVARPALETPADPSAEQVRVRDARPDVMTLDVTMTAPGLVVLSETYDPGWRAYVDGERVPVLAAFRALRAIPVPAGEHTLELRYEPPSLMLSLAISIGTAALLALVAVALLRRRAIGRPALVGHRVEGWLSPGLAGRRPRWGEALGARLESTVAALEAIPTRVALGGLTIVGAAIRLVDLASVAPEIGARLTATAADRPWSAAIGLDGLRASSPPLFVAAAKLVSLGGVDRLADHVVSALAGAATIPVVYALGARLLGRGVGLAAAVLLALSPVHLALSRSGEAASAGLLVVAASYLALVAVVQGGPRGRGWLALYAASLVVALYTDPTTAYALAPGLVVGHALLRRDGRGRSGLLAAGAVGLLAGVPWLLRLPDAATAPEVERGREAYLAQLWDRLVDALPLVVGLDGLGSWVRVDRPIWVAAPALVLLLGAVPAGLAGLMALRGPGRASLICRATIVAAPLVAVLASLLADGLAPATLAPALIGWSILASAWLARGRVGVDVRRWGAIGWSVLVLASLLAVPATYGSRQDAPWRDASPGLTSQARAGIPIFVEGGDPLADRATVSLVAGDLGAIDGSDRWLADPAYEQIDATELRSALSSSARPVDALWLLPRLETHHLREPLIALGFRLAMGLELDRSRLELWSRTDAPVGEAVPIDGGFREPANLDDTWRLTGTAAIQPPADPVAGGTLAIGGGASRATYRLASGPGLYLVETDVRTDGPALGRATLKCVSADGVDLVKQTITSSEGLPAGSWQPVAAATLCPEGTVSLAIVLDKRGVADVDFRDVTLRGSPTDLPTDPDFGVEAPQVEAGEPSDIDVSDG